MLASCYGCDYMAKPTLIASIVGKEKANAAFKRSGKTQEFVAGTSGTTRQLVSNFLKGLSVEQLKFIAICEALELRWQEIAELDKVEVTNDSNLKELELLVQEVKQKIAADVTERCGTMRVLDMTQPVDLDRIYTDVNIIKDVTGRRRIGYDEVMEVCTREHFDRFLVGTIKERVKGFEAVEEFQKLVVLGKPGAGKTTFMKYLAMSCLGSRFHGELVPIFVTLKAYAEERGQPSLENYILTEFEKRKVSQDVAKQLLDEGKALILLDGLDEVKKEDDRRVKQDIDQFSRDWLKNRFAITCRIAAREYQFEKFTEVEVADFDDGQIKTFVNNWFRERDESKSKLMLERLENNEPVKELAKSPLLLTLLCLVFGESNDFRPKRSELYKEGSDYLLKCWDNKRDIKRDFPRYFRGEQIYRNLSTEDKANMIGKIAFNTFTNGEYFFRQEDLQRQIKDYICNLPEASADPDVLRLDSEVVLKAIEHHHGLLVERARNIYSFSHLTFQEYFTAKAIERGQQLEILVENISNPRWKEVFYLTAEMLWRSDDFLKLMKKRIDGILANDEKLQAFLRWTNEKANSVDTKDRYLYAYHALNQRFYEELKFFLSMKPNFSCDLDQKLYSFIHFTNNLILDLYHDQGYAVQNTNPNDINAILLQFKTEDAMLQEMFEDIKNKLQDVLQDVESKSPDIKKRSWDYTLPYYNEFLSWIPKFRDICIDRRNIGHDWQFTNEQIELLKQYYAANLLLVECMNRSYVSKQVREEIESTMLLPSKK
jgi:predicted NACHT family NTPase